MAKQEDFLPKEDGKLCVECGFGEWRHGLGSSHQFNANLNNHNAKQIRAIIGEIPNYIFEYLELSDSIKKEWKLGNKASDFGGHNQFVQKYTKAIEAEILKHYISREEVLGKLPKKKTGLRDYKDSDGELYVTCKECGGYDECDCSGYNQALSDMRQALTTNVKE